MATTNDFLLSRDPSDRVLTLKIHLLPMITLSLGSCTKVYVLFLISALYLLSMDAFQRGSCNACLTEIGSLILNLEGAMS